MKTVLSNTKRFLAVFLALAMVVLAVPNAPTDLLAAEVDPEVEAVETTEAEAPVEEDVAAPAEAEEPAAVEESVDAEEPVVDEAAVGEEAEEEEVAVDEAALGLVEEDDLFIVGEKVAGDEYSEVLNSTVSPNSGVLYLSAGHTGQAIASKAWVEGAGTARESQIVTAGGTAIWTSLDDSIATVEQTADRTAVVTGISAGTTYIVAEYTNDGIRHTVEKDGNNYTNHALKVVVVDLAADMDATTGTYDEESDIWVLKLDTTSGNDEDGNADPKTQEKVSFVVASGNGAQTTGNMVWDVQEEQDGQKWKNKGLSVVAEVTANAYNHVYTADAIGGFAKVTATYTPVDAYGGTGVKLEENIYVDNYTVGIVAKHGVETVTTNDPDQAFENVTGNYWIPSFESVEVGTDNAVTYPLFAYDQLGNDVTDEVSFVDDYASTHPGALNLSVTIDNAAKTMERLRWKDSSRQESEDTELRYNTIKIRKQIFYHDTKPAFYSYTIVYQVSIGRSFGIGINVHRTYSLL